MTLGVTVQPGWSFGASPSQIPSGTTTPTGTVTLCLTQNPNVGGGACPTPTYTINVPLTPAIGPNALQANAVGTFQNVATGWYMVEAQYNGDSNYTPFGLIFLNWIEVDTLPVLVPTTTTLTVSPTSISGTAKAQVTATVARNDNGDTAPTGIVELFSNGRFLYEMMLLKAGSGASASVTFQPAASWFWNGGANDLTAVYFGDGSTFGPSQSSIASITVSRATVADFAMAAQTPQVNVQSGGTATAALNLAALSGVTETVSLTCATSSSQFQCSMNPTSLQMSGSTTASVTITAKRPSQASSASSRPCWPVGVLAASCVFALRRKMLRRLLVVIVATFAFLSISACGAGGSASSGGGGLNPDNTPAGRYNVIVSASSGAVVHNVRLTVVVQ